MLSSLTEDYNLELQYRKPFLEIWEDEKNDRELGPLSERMGVRDRMTGALLMTAEEREAVSEYSCPDEVRCGCCCLSLLGFYHAFCFYKV